MSIEGDHVAIHVCCKHQAARSGRYCRRNRRRRFVFPRDLPGICIDSGHPSTPLFNRILFAKAGIVRTIPGLARPPFIALSERVRLTPNSVTMPDHLRQLQDEYTSGRAQLTKIGDGTLTTDSSVRVQQLSSRILLLESLYRNGVEYQSLGGAPGQDFTPLLLETLDAKENLDKANSAAAQETRDKAREEQSQRRAWEEEDLLLNVELKYGYGANRLAFRKAGILPLSAKFKMVFP